MKLKEQINFMVAQVLLEIRSNFRWKDFKSLSTQEQKLQYLWDTSTEMLGEGSSRMTFLLSSRYVLKLARPDAMGRGTAQNKVEAELSADSQVNEILAPVHDFADDYSWLVSELVRPIDSRAEFEELTGLDFDNFDIVLNLAEHGGVENRLKSLKKDIEDTLEEIAVLEEEEKDLVNSNDRSMSIGRKLQYIRDSLAVERKQLVRFQKNLASLALVEEPFVQAVMNLMKSKQVLSADLGRIEHWGKTSSGKVVLLDYGYTDEVYSKHYQPRFVSNQDDVVEVLD